MGVTVLRGRLCRGGDPDAGRLGFRTQSLVPRGEQEVVGAHGERAGQMDCAGSAQRLLAGQLAGASADRLRQLDRPSGRPVLLAGRLGLPLRLRVQTMLATRSGQRRSR